MKEMIEWLTRMEKLAATTYSKAALYFSENKTLSTLIQQSAEDEANHYEIMQEVSEYHKRNPIPNSDVLIDIAIQYKIENTLLTIVEQMENNTLTEKSMMELFISLEYSEWNDIFLYVVSYLKVKTEEFKQFGIHIQNHLKIIENFISNLPYESELKSKIIDLPPIWTENILIVDDDAIVAKFMGHLLNRDGNIDTVYNGQEGIEAIKKKYYKLIISDIDMPVMDGITFYKNTIELMPAQKSKFLFMSGDISDKRKQFFTKNNLSYLPKPSPIKKIRQEALNILLSR